MVGGESEAARRIMPLLAALGGAIFRTGPLGSGHAMKALNNYVSAAGLAAAAEAVIVGSHFGLDPLVIVDVLNASTGRNNSRTEEHTSELQSLMRRSYAVFCFKIKKHRHITRVINTKPT